MLPSFPATELTLARPIRAVGPMPDNPAEFSFWMAEVMPVDEHVKAAMLP